MNIDELHTNISPDIIKGIMHTINYVLDTFINIPINNTNVNNNSLEKAQSFSSLAYEPISNIQETSQKLFELLTLNIKINNCNYLLYNMIMCINLYY